MSTFYRPLLLFCVASIFAMGLVMIFNTTSAEVLDHALDRSTHQALFKQIIYCLVGLAMAGGVWYVGYQKMIAWSPYLLGFFCFLLLLTLIPGIGKEVNGSRRWIGAGGLYFQPSEFVKYVVPAYFCYCLQGIDGSTLELRSFLKIIGKIGVPILLILVEPNNGTAGVIGLLVVVMCVMTRIRFKYWALPLSIFLVIGAVSAYNLPYVSARLKVYLHPELDLRGKGHQPYQAKIAAGSGQLFGRGPGNSLQKLSYLPEAQNDYIAAIYAEEFGFLGIVSLIVLYMIIGYVGFYIAHTTFDRSGFYFATAITFLICFQAFMNLGVVSGLLPSTGLNLPFFSQGGTSLMANIMGLGLLLNIAHSQKEQQCQNGFS
ncbi:cell division protein FtsW [Candidatus Protochlamydia naegleriophila]|uniref:Probable peptidoglycan glycosyltransferase FtsW n=1 Tax=Candidatus Protochlamydia naegleriophila TaxID=389348 RepID=A0A0U5JAV8_9BACT|nr:putative lipid II flippase FtsW [Candidatus Protochlamydia naegleriophila]CUI16247.1 cell division protein FtsW [Candidatus Protochlamydia naegleriophila]